MFRSSSKKKEKEAAGLSPKISAKLDLGSESDPKTPTSSILGGEVKVPTALRAGSHGSSMEVKLGGGGSSSSYSSSSGGGGGGGVEGGLSLGGGGVKGGVSVGGGGGSSGGGLSGSSGGSGVANGSGGMGSPVSGSWSRSIGGGLNGDPTSPSPTTGLTRSSYTSKISASSPSLAEDNLRPMSPQTRLICLSRIDEKNALVTLNDRLAAILSRNRQLEAENHALSTQLREGEHKLTLISNQITTSFEAENAELRRRLELVEKEKAKLELELRKLTADYNEALLKLKKKESEIGDLLKQIAGLNGRITLLSTDLRRLEEDKGKGTAERDELRAEISRLTTQLSGLEAQVEEEVMGKVELQHALQNKGDELQMKVQVHQQQFAEMLSSKSSDVSEAGLKLQQEYEARLAAAIRQLRVDCELQIAANREEQEGLYAMRESALKGEMERMSGALAGKGGELSSIQMKLAALEKRLSGLDGENAALQRSLGEMEMSWQADKAGFSAEKLRLEGIIGEMTAERQQLIADYQGLLEIKVALVNEISTYRALLDGEEERWVEAAGVRGVCSYVSLLGILWSAYLERLQILMAESEEMMLRNLEGQMEGGQERSSGGTQRIILSNSSTTFSRH